MQFLGRDIVFHVVTVFCFSIVTMSRQRFPCRDRDGHDKRSCVAIGWALDIDFMSQQSLVKAKGFHVMTENFYAKTEFPRVVSRQSILCRDKV